MRPPDRIADFVSELARRLDFDRHLGQRVCREVEDHLWEAAMSRPHLAEADAQGQAIKDFGEPERIAEQYLALSLFGQAKRVGKLIAMAVAAIFVGMNARSAWYGLANSDAHGILPFGNVVGIWIDRGASVLALTIGIVAWLHVRGRQAPLVLRREDGIVLGRSLTICAAATVFLAVAIVTDVALLGTRLLTAPASVAVLPAMLLSLETAFAGHVVYQLCSMLRLMAFARPSLRSTAL